MLTAIRGSSGCQLQSPLPTFLTVANSFCSCSKQIPISLSSYLPSHPSSQLSTRLEVHSGDWNILLLLQKSTLGKDKTPPPPLSDSAPFTPLYLCKPPFKGKNQAPGLLRVGLHLRAPVAGSGEAARAPSGAGAGARAVTWERRAGRQVSLAAPVPTLLTAARQGKWQI